MTFNITYRIYVGYFGNRALDFLTLKACQEEVRYQQTVNLYNPTIYEVTTSYQGEQIVNTEERVLENAGG